MRHLVYVKSIWSCDDILPNFHFFLILVWFMGHAFDLCACLFSPQQRDELLLERKIISRVSIHLFSLLNVWGSEAEEASVQPDTHQTRTHGQVLIFFPSFFSPPPFFFSPKYLLDCCCSPCIVLQPESETVIRAIWNSSSTLCTVGVSDSLGETPVLALQCHLLRLQPQRLYLICKLLGFIQVLYSHCMIFVVT